MLYSENKKFIFIAVPKTGTTSIENLLTNLDRTIERNVVRDSKGSKVSVDTHATASQIRQIMGQAAEQYTFVAFVRNPKTTIQSKYYFYKHGRAADRHNISRLYKKHLNLKIIQNITKVYIAKMLPFNIWVWFYPFSSFSKYITDKRGNIIVDEIGCFENFSVDLSRIITLLGYSNTDRQIPNLNSGPERSRPPLSKIAKLAISMKIRSDVKIYRWINRNNGET